LFRRNAEIAAIQPKIRSFEADQYFEFAGAGGGLIDNLAIRIAEEEFSKN
jgi:hypothetical protein